MATIPKVKTTGQGEPKRSTVVIHIATHDGSFSQTQYYGNVVMGEIESETTPRKSEFEEILFGRPAHIQIGNISQDVRIRFTAEAADKSGNIVYVYDNLCATPNLDHFLGTFNKEDRIAMAEDYVKKQRAVMEAFMKDNEKLVVGYLEEQGYEFSEFGGVYTHKECDLNE